MSPRDAAWKFAATYFGKPRMIDEFGVDHGGRFKLQGGGMVYRVQLTEESGRSVYQVSRYEEPAA